jgi:hypothetical protein
MDNDDDDVDPDGFVLQFQLLRVESAALAVTQKILAQKWLISNIFDKNGNNMTFVESSTQYSLIITS